MHADSPTCSAARNAQQFQEDLAQEQADLQEELDKFRFYPVLSAGISYQF